MVTSTRTYRWLLLALGSLSLSGCFSGTIAAQIASSMATHLADKAIASSLEAQRRADEAKGIALKDTTPDEYWSAFLTSGFSTIAPTIEPTAQSLPPDYRQAAFTPPPQTSAQTSRLVNVEIWNLVIGEEKTRILENAARVGASLPDKLDWPNWQLATGSLDTSGQKSIYFLVPPEMGRVRSGAQVVVEVFEVGGLHTARYLAEPATTQAMLKDRSGQNASQSARFQLSYSR